VHVVIADIMYITRFSMDIVSEDFHNLKVVNWVGIPMSWEQSANEENWQLQNGDSLNGAAHAINDCYNGKD
jgi:hypothetical protein